MAEQLQLDLGLEPAPDIECARTITILVEVPFFGKEDQAEKFVADTFPKLMHAGVSSEVRVVSYTVE